ncbi:MAG TPA: hypothetical protein VFQ44_23015 [Streptosporangiaceae bacterium]|nr:hypothetical protein [Streptosporangiaceae bacterium]
MREGRRAYCGQRLRPVIFLFRNVYDAVPNLFQADRIDCNLVFAIDGSFDYRRISATHLIREAERWNALGIGEAERIVTATVTDFATALNRVTVPSGVPRRPRRS